VVVVPAGVGGDEEGHAVVIVIFEGIVASRPCARRGYRLMVARVLVLLVGDVHGGGGRDGDGRAVLPQMVERRQRSEIGGIWGSSFV
jgi:hypothetical protein